VFIKCEKETQKSLVTGTKFGNVFQCE